MTTTAENKLTRMLSLMSNLCGVLKKENTLLKNQRQSECKNLTDQKSKLAAAYAESFAYFAKHADIIKALPERQKRVLRKASVTLGDLTTENARLLKINIEATNRLLNAIVQDVQEQTHARTPLYTKQGNMENDVGNPAAISFNQVL